MKTISEDKEVLIALVVGALVLGVMLILFLPIFSIPDLLKYPDKIVWVSGSTSLFSCLLYVVPLALAMALGLGCWVFLRGKFRA